MQPHMDEQFVARCRRGDAGISDNDVRMALAVLLELYCDMRTRTEPVRVSAENEVVILAGTVSSWEARRAAADAARDAVQAVDFCNVLRVPDGVPGDPPVDTFDRLVATVDPPGRDSRAAFSPRRGIWFVATVVLMAWLVMPWLVIAGVAVVPAVIAALAITAAGAMTTIFRPAEPGPPPYS